MRGSRSPGRAALAAIVLLASLNWIGVAHATPPTPNGVSGHGGGQSEKACAHPYPCSYQWQGPAGPYEVLPSERVSVTSFDGVQINGFILRPNLPPEVPVPVILTATPYMQPGTVPTGFHVGGVPGRSYAAAGYAVAAFSVRGTGDSGGCFGMKSKAEQRDLPIIIDWLARQPWSNGRVGMQGISYPGTTPVMAAIQNPPALKTIVIAGTILDEYGFNHSPQGAALLPVAMTNAVFGAARGITVPYSLPPRSAAGIATAPERLCPELLKANTVGTTGEATGDRDAQFWSERRFIDGVPGITAATFVVHGFQDRWGSGHAFQDDWAWQTLQSAPKRMLVGQWWHEWPSSNSIYPEYKLTDWPQRQLAWYDYWLKGWGDAAPGLGEVEFQDSSGALTKTDAWPPPLAKRGADQARGPHAGLARRHDEVLYLREQGLQPDAGREAASFVSVFPPWTGGNDPNLTGIGGPSGNGWRWSTPCPDPTRLVYTSEPVQQRTLLAGNAFGSLKLESSAPAGVYELQLYDVGPDFDCDDPPTARSEDVRPLTEGAADLRYHTSQDYRAKPFPVLTPTQMRVDIANLAEVLEPGHRLAVVVSHGFWRGGTTPDPAPVLTLHGDGGPASSHLVLPVVTGGFGGAAPTLSYPPTPFLPDCCEDPAADGSRR
jgi:putative CocE/NonD family hydrolase